MFCLENKEMTDKRDRRKGREITLALQMTGKWLTIIIKIMKQIGPNGSILTSQMKLGCFNSRKLVTKFEVLIPVLISSRVCCDVTLCLWLSCY